MNKLQKMIATIFKIPVCYLAHNNFYDVGFRGRWEQTELTDDEVRVIFNGKLKNLCITSFDIIEFKENQIKRLEQRIKELEE